MKETVILTLVKRHSHSLPVTNTFSSHTHTDTVTEREEERKTKGKRIAEVLDNSNFTYHNFNIYVQLNASMKPRQ